MALNHEHDVRVIAEKFYDKFCFDKRPGHQRETLSLKDPEDVFMTRASVSAKLAERYSELVNALMDVRVIEYQGTDRISNLLNELKDAEDAAIAKKRQRLTEEDGAIIVVPDASTSNEKRRRLASEAESIGAPENGPSCRLSDAVSRAAADSSSLRKSVSKSSGNSVSFNNHDKVVAGVDAAVDGNDDVDLADDAAEISHNADLADDAGLADDADLADDAAEISHDAGLADDADLADDVISDSSDPKKAEGAFRQIRCNTEPGVKLRPSPGASNGQGVETESDDDQLAPKRKNILDGDASAGEDSGSDDDLPVYVSNSCYASYLSKAEKISELQGIDKHYTQLSFDDIINNRNGEIAKKNVVHVYELFGQIIVKDLVDDIKKSYRLDANVAALWSFTRKVLGCGQGEIVEMKFKDFFKVIRKLAQKTCSIRKLPVPVCINGKTIWRDSKQALTKEEHSFNSDLNRRINVFSSRLMKRVVHAYEKLNQDVLLSGKLSGCGFVLSEVEDNIDEEDDSGQPSSPLGKKSSKKVCEEIQVSDRFAVEFVKSNTFSSVGYAEFKHMLYQKKDRDDPDTWFAKQKKVLAERAEQREQKKLNTSTSTKKNKDKKRSEQLPSAESFSANDRQADDEGVTSDESLLLLTPTKTAHKSGVGAEGATKRYSRCTVMSDDDELNFDSSSPSPIAANEESISDVPVNTASEITSNSVLNESSFSAFDDCCLKKTDMTKAYDTVKVILQRIKSTFGQHGDIRIKCDTAKNKRIQSTVQYNLALVHLILTVLKHHQEDNNVMDISDLLMTDPSLQEIRFKAFRAVAESELTASYGHTKGDGYCLARACTQNAERSKNPNMSMAELKAFDQALPREQLVVTIQNFLDCMKCRDKDVDIVMKAKLENMKYLALNFPKRANPMNNWGSSQMCRFLDGEVMIFNYDTNNAAPVVMSDGTKGVWGDLSVLNYGVLDKLFPCNHPPTLTLDELVKVFQVSNNIAFRFSHFFVLENHREKDTVSVVSAVQDWVDGLVSVALDMKDDEQRHMQDFADGYSKLGQWDLENSRITHVSVLSNILVDLTQDDQEDAAVESTVIDKDTGKPICADVQMTNSDLIETVSRLFTLAVCVLLSLCRFTSDQEFV